MKKIKYSFLIPNYNKSHNLLRCITNILDQDIVDYEVVIVDDSSTDNSLTILNEIKKNNSKIRIYKNKKNIGIGLTRKKLLKLAKGDFIIFVDSDDYVIPKMLNYIDRDDIYNYDMIRYQNVVEPATEEQKLKELTEDKYRFCYTEKKIVSGNDIIVDWCTNPYCANALLWTYCIKKNLFIENKIDFPDLKFHEDFSVVPLLIANSKKILIINDILYHYLQYDNSITKMKNQKMDFKSKYEFYKNKYYQYKEATMLILNNIDNSILDEKITNVVKTKLRIRLKERYDKYTKILYEDFKGEINNEKDCLF